MIYLIGGAPRAGKSILGQQISAKLRVGQPYFDMTGDFARRLNEAEAMLTGGS